MATNQEILLTGDIASLMRSTKLLCAFNFVIMHYPLLTPGLLVVKCQKHDLVLNSVQGALHLSKFDNAGNTDN
jgi:hypothetical protein